MKTRQTNGKGYRVYFNTPGYWLILPVTPGQLKIKIGTKNQVVNLISGGDINQINSPTLTEISFQARFPLRVYPYSRYNRVWDQLGQDKSVDQWNYNFKFLQQAVEQKKPVWFTVERNKPDGTITWDTHLQVSIESMNMKQSAQQGDDILIQFQLKQYKHYGIKTLKKKDDSTSTSPQSRPDGDKPKQGQEYVVQKGDTLWGLALKYYKDGSKYPVIFQANKEVMEKAAKDAGYPSADNGNVIIIGTKLIIPKLDANKK